MQRYTDHICERYARLLSEIDEEVALKRFAEYEDIGKEPKEIQETLDKDNRLIAAYAEENERLSNIIECLKDEIKKQDEQLKAVYDAAKAVHDTIIELDSLICV